ncbi:hypothetical protein TIFTF001_034026 [Ficus carica]|uniref:Uncharacterized protein n=1 Tax=Ficus carica TaxID=3494 RepID=A0AA88J7X0_FICCA|nr:hypothetical protein TIFTF001_034026 [Ficus carica]
MVGFREMGRDWDYGSKLGSGFETGSEFETRVRIQNRDRDSWPESKLDSTNEIEIGFRDRSRDSRLKTGVEVKFWDMQWDRDSEPRMKSWSSFGTGVGIEIYRNVT